MFLPLSFVGSPGEGQASSLSAPTPILFTYQSREAAGDLALGFDGDRARRALDVRWKGMFSRSLSLL